MNVRRRARRWVRTVGWAAATRLSTGSGGWPAGGSCGSCRRAERPRRGTCPPSVDRNATQTARPPQSTGCPLAVRRCTTGQRLLSICINQVAPLFFNIDFPWLFHDQKNENPWPIGTTYMEHIFPSKRCTTYKCIPELVVTVPSARSTIAKKIKRLIIWHYKWSRVTFTELHSAVVKIPWRYHHFLWLSVTSAIFHDFPGLENGLPKFHDHDFPWPGGTLPDGVSTGAACIWRLSSSSIIQIDDRSHPTDCCRSYTTEMQLVVVVMTMHTNTVFGICMRCSILHWN